MLKESVRLDWFGNWNIGLNEEENNNKVKSAALALRVNLFWALVGIYLPSTIP